MAASSRTAETAPATRWTVVRRGLHVGANGRVYVSRVRYGWEFGTVSSDGTLTAHDWTTRPINRAKVLAERCVAG